MREIIKILKALADETRLRIVNILSVREFCVCEIQEILAMSEPRISRHLRILKDAGLVSARVDGRWIYYRINREAKLESLFPFLKEGVTENKLFKGDIEKAKKTHLVCSVKE